MAIDPLSSSGPPGGFAQVFPVSNRQATNIPATAPGAPAPANGSAAASTATSTMLPDAVDAAGQAQTLSPARRDIEDAVSKVQRVVAGQANNLLFSIDDDSGRTVVKVVDSMTNETIRQIPSEEVLSIAKALDKLQGLLLKQTA